MGERLTFSYKNFKLEASASPDCRRFNELVENMELDFIDCFTYPFLLRREETRADMGLGDLPAKGRTAKFALYRVWDKNGDAPERVEDYTYCTRTLKAGMTTSNGRFMAPGTRVSYVNVLRIDKDTENERPCEFIRPRTDLYENLMDPKVYVIARGYSGKVAQFANYYVDQFEKPYREGYKVLIDEGEDPCMIFFSESHHKIMLGAALVSFGLEKGGVPNRTNIPPKDILPL